MHKKNMIHTVVCNGVEFNSNDDVLVDGEESIYRIDYFEDKITAVFEYQGINFRKKVSITSLRKLEDYIIN